jgi:hypothetical protein
MWTLAVVLIAIWLTASAVVWIVEAIVAWRRKTPLPRVHVPRATSDPKFGRTAAAATAAQRDITNASGGRCDPNYEGACLDPDASDYDCEGGSGDGPEYTGTVRVVGDDPYDLDRDGDGTGCDP